MYTEDRVNKYKDSCIKIRLPQRGVVYLRVVNNEVNTLNKGYE